MPKLPEGVPYARIVLKRITREPLLDRGPESETYQRTMRLTMRDVARAAGVSVITVSYVLSRRSGVSIREETSERVLQEARRLNYRHNALAADLRRGATRLVGIQLYSLA